MPNSPTSSKPMALHPDDFDPPLKRKEPSVPGYWTVDEIAAELNLSNRRITYDITGYPPRKMKPSLKAYKAGPTFLVPDENALAYIQKYRERKKS